MLKARGGMGQTKMGPSYNQTVSYRFFALSGACLAPCIIKRRTLALKSETILY